MLLAQKGIPEGGSVGYEIFDKDSGLGTTRFDQDMKQLRALEGELIRTINTLKPIESSRVHLVLPKRELFSRDERPASASIFLKVRQGKQLSDEQVMAIQHLVATAVPGLNPKRVSIVDQAGNLLANGREDGDAMTTANIEKLRMAYEQRMMYSLEDMITRIVGVGKVRAHVTADIDYDKEVTNAEMYDPEGQVARSTQNIQEDEQEKDKSESVSVQNNLPGLPNENGDTGTSRNSGRTEEITNFEISKTVKNHVREGGQIRNISVAILVDGIYAKDKDGKIEYTPRTQQELDNIKALVSSAMGYNEKRGDKLEVVNMRFADGEDSLSTGIDETVFMGMTKDDVFRLAETGVLGLVAVLIVLLVLRPMAGKLLAPPEETAMQYAMNPDGTPMLDSEGKPMLSGPHIGTLMIDNAGGADGADGEESMIDVASVDGKIRASSIQKVNEIIDRYPNEAVSIIRSWMFQEG
jgi:flagellar M-ring protein FliF